MNSVKSQSKASGETSRSGTFQKGENISRELTSGGLMPLVSPGMPSPILEPSQPIPFKGVTHSVTDNGEVTSILLLTEVNLSTDDPMAIRPPIIITLSNLKSYTFSTYHETHYRVEAHWDQEAQVWFASCEEVSGLATEAETIESLRKKLRVMVPELLQLNGSLPKDLPHMLVIDLISHRQDLVEIA